MTTPSASVAPVWASQHDDAQRQRGPCMGKSAPVRGGILRRAQRGREPEARQTVETDIAGLGFETGLGQQLHAGAVVLLPFQHIAQRIDGCRVKSRRTGNIVSHVQQDLVGLAAFGHGRNDKAQPGCAADTRQGAQIERHETGGLFRRGYLVDIHAVGSINKGVEIGQQREIGRTQNRRQGLLCLRGERY